MEYLSWLLHLDQHLADAIAWMGVWFYGLVFAIVFCETGLIVTPFLPGDSLLFAIGAVAAAHPDQLNITWLLILLTVAAIAGDAANYSIGKWLGPKVFRMESGWLLNKQHLVKAQQFYETYGNKAIFLARFLPIVRTFAPFVAGIGKMPLRRFWLYNITGAITWVGLFLMGGYFFGTWPIVKENFHWVIVAIILISVVPVAWEWYRARREG